MKGVFSFNCLRLQIVFLIICSAVSVLAEPRAFTSVVKSLQDLPASFPVRFERKGASILIFEKTPRVETNHVPLLLLQTAASVLLETIGLVSILVMSTATPVLQKYPAVPLLFVIVASSTIHRVIIDTSSIVSIAAKQVQTPNRIPGDASWYTHLRKPFFNPPAWLFPFMWLLVCKPTQLLATLKLMERVQTPWTTLTVFCAHLALGDAWNQVFFGRHKIGVGAVVISVFYGKLLLSTALFYDLDPGAGLLLLPTCGWVTIATLLNFEIYRLNKHKK